MLRMFKRLRFQTNLDKTKSMVFALGFIWGQHGEAAYKRVATGEGATFSEQKRTRVSFV